MAILPQPCHRPDCCRVVLRTASAKGHGPITPPKHVPGPLSKLRRQLPLAHWASKPQSAPSGSPVHTPPVAHVPEQQHSQVPLMQLEPFFTQHSHVIGLSVARVGAHGTWQTPLQI